MKYYRLLIRNIAKSYITYIVLFSVIAYSVCLYSSMRDFNHEAEITTTTVSNNINRTMQYTCNVAETIQRSQEIIQYISSTNETSYYSIKATDFIRMIGNNRLDTVLTFGVINPKSNHILATDGYYDINFFPISTI